MQPNEQHQITPQWLATLVGCSSEEPRPPIYQATESIGVARIVRRGGDHYQ